MPKLSTTKRDRIAELLKAGATYEAICTETQCAARTVAAVKRELAEAGEVDDTDVGCDEDAAKPAETGMLVDKEYLATLEALRDQVIENARLRRVIGGAA